MVALWAVGGAENPSKEEERDLRPYQREREQFTSLEGRKSVWCTPEWNPPYDGGRTERYLEREGEMFFCLCK
jgi:hypothetical protein